MSIGPTELLLIFAVIFLLFGGSHLGALGKGLGEGIANFKKGLSGEGDDKDKTPKQLTGKQDSPSESASHSEKKEG